MITRKWVYDSITGAGIGILAWCAECIRGSFIVGSKMAFFSGASMVAPLAGAYGGTIALISMHVIRLLVMQVPYTQSSWSHIALVYHIPTICAGLYWSWIVYSPYRDYRIVRILVAAVPVLCMVLFSQDPIGSKAWQYTLFWLIPAASALIPHSMVVVHAFASTFIAHAVGSVLWIWTHTIPAHIWLGLIPVVMIERSAMALSMVCCMMLIDYGIIHVKCFLKWLCWNPQSLGC